MILICVGRHRSRGGGGGRDPLLTFIEKDQITNVIPNEYILEYSAAVALMYITKY